MKKLTSALLTILSIFPCCANRPKALSLPLTQINYSYGSQMLPIPSYDITISQKGDSVFAIVFDKNTSKYGYYLVTQPDVMNSLKQVIIEKKIYRYKEHYLNKYVLDGDFWSYSAVFRDDVDERHQHVEVLSSSGSNAGPRGDGLRVLSAKMNEAILDAKFLYLCDENGQEIQTEPEEPVSESTDSTELTDSIAKK